MCKGVNVQKCKTYDEYFKHIIAKLKEEILRNVPDLGLVSIQLLAFDSSNIMHKLILTVANIVQAALHIREHIRLCKMACIVVTYDHIPIFIGSAVLLVITNIYLPI